MVPVNSVAVHHTEHPQTIYSGKLTLYYVAVLVDFRHLRDEARSRINAYLIDDVDNIGFSVRSWLLDTIWW